MSFFSKSIVVLIFLYFIQGLPYGLQARFLPVYLRTKGHSLTSLGFFKMLLAPWLCKALWAPFVDRYSTKQKWLQGSIIGLMITCALTSIISPDNAVLLCVSIFMLNLCAATQDIAVDSIAVNILTADELGQGNTAQIVGYKIGAIFGGGILVWFMDFLGWTGLFLALTLLYIEAFLFVCLSPVLRSFNRLQIRSWAATSKSSGNVKQEPDKARHVPKCDEKLTENAEKDVDGSSNLEPQEKTEDFAIRGKSDIVTGDDVNKNLGVDKEKGGTQVEKIEKDHLLKKQEPSAEETLQSNLNRQTISNDIEDLSKHEGQTDPGTQKESENIVKEKSKSNENDTPLDTANAKLETQSNRSDTSENIALDKSEDVNINDTNVGNNSPNKDRKYDGPIKAELRRRNVDGTGQDADGKQTVGEEKVGSLNEKESHKELQHSDNDEDDSSDTQSQDSSSSSSDNFSGRLSFLWDLVNVPDTFWIMVYVLIYKLGEQGALGMLPLFLVDQHIRAMDVTFWTGVVGQGTSILGSCLGGWVLSHPKYKLPCKLLIYQLSLFRLLPLGMLLWVVMLWASPTLSTVMLYRIAILAMNILLLVSGMVTTATFTMMMQCTRQARPDIQATHYTLLSSLEVFGKLTFMSVCGALVDSFGYISMYLIFVLLAASVLPWLWRYPDILCQKEKIL